MDQSTFNHGKSGDTNPKGRSRSPLLELYTRSLRNEREEKIGHRTSAACGGRLRLCYTLDEGKESERETTNCPPKRVRSKAHLSVERWPAKRKCGPRQQHRSRQRLHNAAPPTVHQLRPLAVRQCTLASVPLADIEVLSRMAAPPQVVPVPRLKLRGEAPMPFAKKRLKYAGSSKPR